MARIAGVQIPNQKRSEIALTYLFGIGKSSAQVILAKAKIDPNKKVGSIEDEALRRLIKIVTEEYTIEGEKRSEVRLNIKRLMDIGAYKGKRHRAGLPVNGQRTKNNARTRKGKVKTVANKKKVTK